MTDELVWVQNAEGKLIQIPKPKGYDKIVASMAIIAPREKGSRQPRSANEAKKRTTRAKKPKVEHPHGTHLRYFSTPGCRCDLCREAATKYSREKRQSYKGNTPQNITHGKVNSYSYFGCRCRPCKDAMLKHLAKYPPSKASRQAKNRRKNEKRKEQRRQARKEKGNN